MFSLLHGQSSSIALSFYLTLYILHHCSWFIVIFGALPPFLLFLVPNTTYTFIDAYSRYTWIYLLHSKSQVLSIFPQFKQMAELQLGTKLTMFQSDNAKEFTALTKFLNVEGIVHRFSCPYTHQQNGRAEWKHRHIVEIGLTLLVAASMPLVY